MFLSFCMLEDIKRKIWKKWKRQISKKNRKITFSGWLWRTMVSFVKMSFFRKIGKHYLCSDGKKERSFSLQQSVFGKWSFFLRPFQVTQNTIKIGASADTGKTQNGIFLEGREPPLTLRRENQYLYFGRFSPCTLGPFSCSTGLFVYHIPTEQVLYYRNLGLYYGLASGTLPLYSDPCLGVRGGCVACDFWLQKCHFGKGPRKEFYYLWYLNRVHA